jgi:hypothetical protein
LNVGVACLVVGLFMSVIVCGVYEPKYYQATDFWKSEEAKEVELTRELDRLIESLSNRLWDYYETLTSRL